MIYAIRLPSGSIKFGRTDGLPKRRFMAIRCKYGPESVGLGVALGGNLAEHKLKTFLRPYAIRGEREIFHPVPLVLRIVSMMAPFPPVPAPSDRLVKKFLEAAE